MEDVINTRLKSLEEQINLLLDNMHVSKELLAPFYCKSIENCIEEYTKTVDTAKRMGICISTDIIKKAQNITDLYGKPHLSRELEDYFTDIKHVWFSNGNTKEDIRNIEKILNISYDSNSHDEIVKTESGWIIRTSRCSGTYSILLCLLYIIIFNEGCTKMDHNISLVVHWAIREIFFPDEDFIDNARRFDYDEYELSNYYGFDKISMMVNISRLRNGGKLPEYSIRELTELIKNSCARR